ncbi:MAG: antibiotic biosynthesis monooxygenase [Bacteroidales bacterium]|nr:antibiotic biosynthesis monooxygenase [Bacteroidales bacterium]
MIIVTVKSNPKPEFKIDFLNEFNNIAKTVREEQGCIEYQIYQKDKDSSDLFVFERWESRDALDAHLKTKHMIEFFETTGSWFELEKELKIYEVSE